MSPSAREYLQQILEVIPHNRDKDEIPIPCANWKSDDKAENRDLVEPEVETTAGIKKVCTKVGLRERKTDFAYWQTQPYIARLAALEQIRQEYHRWRYRAEPRLQSVYSIVER